MSQDHTIAHCTLAWAARAKTPKRRWWGGGLREREREKRKRKKEKKRKERKKEKERKKDGRSKLFYPAARPRWTKNKRECNGISQE